MLKIAKGIYDTKFSTVFSKLLEKTRISCYQIGKYTNVDPAYLSRLKSGEKDNPSPTIIMKISLAIVHLGNNITINDIEELYNSVGRSINLR